MLISGANRLYNCKTAVDDLNVFPVPDGDTGTNMSLTTAAMAQELKALDAPGVTKAADTASFSTLRGARGNSGVILSQIFRGIASSLKGKEECSAADLANALAEGASSAYKAVMKPTEGTILTVARISADGAKHAALSSTDVAEILKSAVESGNAALAKTPEQLPALKEAGVVDAGGQGWMRILEGMLEYIVSGNIVESDAASGGVQTEKAQAAVQADIKFRYCTELLIEKNSGADVDAFRDAITPHGDCMLVIDDDTVVKVHIHTNEPGYVLTEGGRLGEFINIKVENMKRQHSEIIKTSGEVKNTRKAEKPAKKEKQPPEPEKEIGFVAVCSGKGLCAVLTDLGVDRIIEGGQTMNPSAADIAKAVSKVNAKTVFVFPNNKNIIMAAQQAEGLTDKKTIVIPTKNIPECISAMIAFSASKTAEQNKAAFESAAAAVKSAQVTFAARNTEYKGHSIKKGDILGVIGSDIKFIGKTPEAVCYELIDHLADDDSEFITLYSGKGVKKASAKALEEKLSEHFDECEVYIKEGGQPLYYYIISVE